MTSPRPPRQPLVPPGGVDLHVRDMTATFAADMTLRDAQARLAEVGQWLPIDGPADATLGSLVDHDSTGPLRLGYGAWRDLLLGVQFTNGKGELITAGGRTVKNVAGYDLTKFMVGQHGVFGTLVTLTTRTYKRPDGAILARWLPTETVWPAGLLAGPLRPQWATYARLSLRCGYLGDRRTLDWYEATLPSAGPMDVIRRDLQRDVEDRTGQWFGHMGLHNGTGVRFRASVPPARLRELAVGHASCTADAAFGVIVGSVYYPGDEERIRAGVEALGGSVTFGAGPTLLASPSPAERRILERLKDAFDPKGDSTHSPGNALDHA